MGFSEKFKGEVIKAIEGGMSRSEASRKYKVSLSSVRNWMGSVASTPTKKVRRTRSVKQEPTIADHMNIKLREENARLRSAFVDLYMSRIQ